MPGTRTAPTVDAGTATFVRVTLALIDSRGDKRSVSIRASAAIVPAAIETLTAAIQAATNASVYRVGFTYVYEGDALGSNASEAVVESVYDNVAINFKDVAGNRQQTVYIPAPVGDIILDGDIVDTADAIYTAVRDAYDTALAGDYTPITARFTERRDKNDAVPATA